MSLATERPLLVTFGSRGDVQRRFLCAHATDLPLYGATIEPGSCQPGWDGCTACHGTGLLLTLLTWDDSWLMAPCPNCDGAGGWRVCPASGRHCRAAATEAERC
jgi:hypothetical protein